jgi:glycosyltransferase involved in cell wall biosynthesis
MKEQTDMEISVVVPTYNRREIVSRSLQALFAQQLAPSRFEIVVVVDGSTDGTAEALRALKPKCGFRVIEQENRGPSAARNTGYRAAQADLVLFLDDDMICVPCLVEEHLIAQQGLKKTLVYGTVSLSEESPASLGAECFNREIGSHYGRPDQTGGRDWLKSECIFSNASIPGKLLECVGGFDEAFRMREDLELGIRLFLAGADARYADRAVACQYYNKTTADLIKDAEIFAAGDLLIAERYSGRIVRGQVSRLRQTKGLKRFLNRIAAMWPSLGDFALAPLCNLAEVFPRIRPLRNAGVRALILRRRIHWLHRLLELGALDTKSKPRL